MQRRLSVRLIIFGLLLSVGPFQAGAQSRGGIYRVDRAVIANGGSTIHADAYTMPATFGQPTAGALCASSYQLYDGFWGVAGSVDLIFANGFDP